MQNQHLRSSPTDANSPATVRNFITITTYQRTLKSAVCRYYVVRFEPAVHINVNLEGNMPFRLASTIKVHPGAVINPTALLAVASNRE